MNPRAGSSPTSLFSRQTPSASWVLRHSTRNFVSRTQCSRGVSATGVAGRIRTFGPKSPQFSKLLVSTTHPLLQIKMEHQVRFERTWTFVSRLQGACNRPLCDWCIINLVFGESRANSPFPFIYTRLRRRYDELFVFANHQRLTTEAPVGRNLSSSHTWMGE